MAAANHDEGARRSRRQYRLLLRLEGSLEPVMFVLAFAWLWLFIKELGEGLSRAEQIGVTAIWLLFIVEFLLKLYLAPRRLRYVSANWITLVALAVPALRAFR